MAVAFTSGCWKLFVKNSFDSVLQCRVETGDFLVSLLTLFFYLSLKKSPPRSQGLKAFSDPGSFSMLNLRKKHSFLTTSFHSQFQTVWGRENTLYSSAHSHAFLY